MRQRVAAIVTGVLCAAFSVAVPASAQTLTWSVVPSPNQGTGRNALQGVSCASATTCTAVGFYDTSGGRFPRTLIESWNGTGWSVVPNPNRGSESTLDGVSCASATACMAVGTYYNASRTLNQTLIESWDGTSWSVVPSPNAATSAGATNVLSGVSCASATACTAAGYYFTSGGPTRTLIASWDGTRWSVVPSPNPGNQTDVLTSVSCASAAACTAAGTYYKSSGGAARTLIESWDGTGWSVVPSPNPGGQDVFSGVSCVSAAACTAAGTYNNGGVASTLIASWDGTRWSVVPSPNPTTRYNIFYGVSCASATACTAVGYDNNIRQGGAGTNALIESWDGTSWSVVPSPRPTSGTLAGISCASATTCTAAGYHHSSSSGTNQTLVESGTAGG
jgi:hypothetical protein